MILPFCVSLIVAGTVFLAAEITRRKLGKSNEISRKLVHSIHGLLVAFWPFVIGFKWVIVIEVLFLASVMLARHMHLFRWMWRVGRKSWGEVLYPIGIIVAAVTADSKWIYLAAALELGLADAAAALVGKGYGRHNSYAVFGQKKSWAGSLAFVVVSCLILGLLVAFSPLTIGPYPVLAVALLAVGLAVTENLGVFGLDNFLLPVITVMVLNLLA